MPDNTCIKCSQKFKTKFEFKNDKEKDRKK